VIVKVALIVLVAMSFAGCQSGDVESTEDYQAGYRNGLEDQRAHICAVMAKHEAAIAALRTERICI
jgi:outer membrane lipoprotein SlyB